jgi:hypothetical protein
LRIERWQTQGTGAGEGALSDSAPSWRGTALQYPTNAKKTKAKKKKHRQRAKNVVWRGVGAGDSKTKTDGHTTGGGFIAYHVPLFPLFPVHPLPLDRNIFFIWIFSLGAKNVWGYYGRY